VSEEMPEYKVSFSAVIIASNPVNATAKMIQKIKRGELNAELTQFRSRNKFVVIPRTWETTLGTLNTIQHGK